MGNKSGVKIRGGKYTDWGGMTSGKQGGNSRKQNVEFPKFQPCYITRRNSLTVAEATEPPPYTVLASPPLPEEINPELPVQAAMTFSDEMAEHDKARACLDPLSLLIFVTKLVTWVKSYKGTKGKGHKVSHENM